MLSFTQLLLGYHGPCLADSQQSFKLLFFKITSLRLHIHILICNMKLHNAQVQFIAQDPDISSHTQLFSHHWFCRLSYVWGACLTCDVQCIGLMHIVHTNIVQIHKQDAKPNMSSHTQLSSSHWPMSLFCTSPQGSQHQLLSPRIAIVWGSRGDSNQLKVETGVEYKHSKPPSGVVLI